MTLKTIPCAPQWACSDCIMQLVNGQSPVDMTDADEQDWWERYITTMESLDEPPTLGMLREFHGCGKSDNPEEECECEQLTFSSQPCAICKSALAGSRDAITFWVKPDIDAIIKADAYKDELPGDERAILTQAALDGNEAATAYMVTLTRIRQGLAFRCVCGHNPDNPIECKLWG